MDEFAKRALEQFREQESSALGRNRRRLLDEFDSARTALDAFRSFDNAQSRAALDAFRSFDNAQARAALDAFRSFEAAQARAALDAMKMPDISRTAFDAMKNLSLHSDAIDQAMRATPFLDAIRESERQIATLFRHERYEMLNAIQRATESFRFDAVQNALSTFDRLNLTQLGSIAGSAGLAALSFNNPALESVFSSDSFANRVADSVRAALAAHKFDASAFEGLDALIDEKLAKLPQDKVTAYGVYEVIRDIVLIVLTLTQVGGMGYQIIDAKQQAKQQTAIAAQQDARWSEALQFLKQTAENTAKLVPENDAGKYYVVERNVVLRIKPQSKAAKIVILFPNQRVLLVKDNHKWIYIEYFDYLEGVPKYGWAMKKYFRRTD